MKKERAFNKAQKYRDWAEIARKKLEKLEEVVKWQSENFDFTEPIKLGHHSQRKHERMIERRNNLMRTILELDRKMKSHLSKAENLESFASRNKGDADRKREEKRAFVDTWIKVGMEVQTFVYGVQVVQKINKNTVRMESGVVVEKSFLEKI